jgi:hypothetical protein
MKKLYYAFLVLALLGGCKKDKDSTDSDPNLVDTKYANKSVSQSKADIENTGISMVTEMKSLNQEKGMEAAVNLLSLLSDDESSMIAQSTLKSVANYQKNNDVTGLLSSLRKNESAPEIIENFKKVAGVYNYNFDTKELDSTEASTNIVIKFPASKTAKDAKKLNGTLTIQRPEVLTGVFTYGDAEVKELPTLISFDIKVDGEAALSYSFVGKYDSKGIPSNITSTLTIGTFELKAALNYATSASDVNYSIKHGTKVIIDMGAGVNGNFDKTNIENAYHNEYRIESRYNWETNEFEDYTDTVKVVDPDKILYKANAHFQFMNIKISGQIDFKDLYVNQKAISDKVDNNTITKDEGDKQLVDLINKDAALIVVYANDNTMIAKTEAYLRVDNNVDDMGSSYSNKYVDIQMVFADKSKNSLDAYFKEGFSDFVSETNSFITDLNSKYGWNVEPVQDPSKTTTAQTK